MPKKNDNNIYEENEKRKEWAKTFKLYEILKTPKTHHRNIY